MDKRMIGKSTLEVGAIGLGCMGMSEFYGESDEWESIRTIHQALDWGVTLLDTADMYGVGENEVLVGKAIAGRRSEVTLATKFGCVRNADGDFVAICGRPEYVKSACEASLKRLGVEVIDLYYQHRVDPDTPIEETIGAMADLVHAGKVRYIGMSEAAASTIRRAHAVHSVTAVQTEYSLWSRDVEDEILPACRELGIGFIPYSPLGRGFLTGQIKKFDDFALDDFRRYMPRFQGENFYKNLVLADTIKELAEQKGCKPSQLALAWLLAQGKDIIPIPGTKRISYLEENLGAIHVQLTSDDFRRIDEIAPKGAASGDRYDDMEGVNI
jgi:aryl-alcohol dehydrogenase-like predicted oxidoreductase